MIGDIIRLFRLKCTDFFCIPSGFLQLVHDVFQRDREGEQFHAFGDFLKDVAYLRVYYVKEKRDEKTIESKSTESKTEAKEADKK